ncbi:hypothetical protein GO755_36075 [Spirosoma sp. HMF4905]|uniref:T9SS type A sorting domain-containing protein n=1 Tax=Spirosoma arboris TaxID=2682092 RepID=A0A7K1SPI6_9BACT|nr:hypothetical protein [Spirosoma arboris]MVM35496.1 hypothetical protein [Spirosoma arboris]
MKASKTCGFLFLLSFLAVGYAIAQSPDQYAYTKPDSSKAYWTLRADQTDQTPTVQFYNTHHQLLYQEPLPTSARHVDRQTKRALDKLLAHLVNNRILTTTYLTEKPAVSAAYIPVYRPTAEQSLRHVVLRKGNAVLLVEPSMNPSGKLTVKCAQFSSRWLMVALEDADHQEIFEQRFNTNQYKRSLNLTELPSGLYYLKMGRFNSPIMYRLFVDQSTQQYELQNEDS